MAVLSPAVTTGTANYNKQLTDLVVRSLREEPRADLPWVPICKPASFIAGTNNTMRYLRVADMTVSTNSGTVTPGTQPWLEEGTSPAFEAATIGYEEFSAAQAGRVLRATDIAEDRWGEDESLISVMTERVTRNAAATADLYVRDTVKAGSQKVYANAAHTSVATTAAGDAVIGTTIRKVAAQMKKSLIPKFGDASYHAHIAPGVVFDIEGDTAAGGWIDVQRYATPQNMLTGEIGKYGGIRFIETASAAVWVAGGVAGIDVFATTVFGPEAFVFGDWGTVKVYYTPQGGPGDELHQRSSVGWKSNYGVLRVGEGANATNITPPRYVNIVSAAGA